ncbi:MAG: UvrD-helicase domain-containing protein [Wenzhouxiangella sp.]
MSDDLARQQAVEPGRSVIVQAPAGSGKTSLLVERYLALLAVAEAPEEILAITFTRKAAAEMRERVLQFLDPDFESEAAHEQAALARARAVETRVRDWGLRENPQRMLIRTIDSFNHFLARSMPVASQLGPVPLPADHTQALYREAARRALARLDEGDELAEDLSALLLWRDHRVQDLEDLLVSLLGRREQWLPVLLKPDSSDRAALEQGLHALVVDRLTRVREQLTSGLAAAGVRPDSVLGLLHYAAEQLRAEGGESALAVCSNLSAGPDAAPEALPQWQALAELLLTQTGSWRKSVDKRCGFPPKTPEKDRMVALLDAISPNTALAEALDQARALPTPNYQDEEWRVLGALVRVLKSAATELRLVFAEQGRTDFAGLSAAAQQALGDAETGYTDLALYLDQRIRHILVDEYQDTNWSQFHLLEKLVGSWQADEARSLFLVGDPMQSIYRFREAEVGLFMRTRGFGIAGQSLQPLKLTRNFRSRREIVEWVNQRLGPIFPHAEDIAAGAVAYAESEPALAEGGSVRLVGAPDPVGEAQVLAELIADAIERHKEDPKFKAALIVRARSHLKDILPALKARGIAYRAVKLDPLTHRPLVQDLLALTRAVMDPDDTASVLAVLRSPPCGLSLADLHALAGDGRRLDDVGALDRLSGEARTRAERVFDVMQKAAGLWRRRPLRDLVEGAWHALGGPALCQNPATDQRDARLYFETLEQAEAQGLLPDWNAFAELLDGASTEGDPPDENVRLEVLTMHGAKGLEWDLVVLPQLHRGTGGNNQALLHWLPLTPDRGAEQVLLAPLRSARESENPPLVKFMQAEQQQREAYERQRLLYVACTRARKELVLSACLKPENPNKVPKATLLADLWPGVGAAFVADLEARTGEGASPPPSSAEAVPDQSIRRVSANWTPPLQPAYAWRPALPRRERPVEIEFNWAGTEARRIGTVLHRLLELVGRSGIESLDAATHQRLAGRIPILLAALGSAGEELRKSEQIVREALDRTLASETGRWILSGTHQDAACELPLSGMVDGQLVNAIIDRTFIDADGVRWIIDYKSGYHAGGALDNFLGEEAERYSPQLDLYRRLFEQMGESEIRAALYLPRHDRLQIVSSAITDESVGLFHQSDSG